MHGTALYSPEISEGSSSAMPARDPEVALPEPSEPPMDVEPDSPGPLGQTPTPAKQRGFVHHLDHKQP